MLINHRPIKTVITGKSGSGKTTYFQRLLENGFGSYWQTVFLYDWQGEMAQRLRFAPVLDFEALPSELERGFVIFDPAREFEADYTLGLQAFSRWSFEICKTTNAARYPRLFACDEMQLLMGNDECLPEVQSVIQTGRRVGLDMAIVAQQLNELHNIARSQTTERVTFQHEDPYVLSVMAKWGFDPEAVAALPVGEFLYRNDRGEERRDKLF